MTQRALGLALDGGTEALVEALDATTGSRLLLLAGIEGVAVRAHIQRKVMPGR